MRFGFIKDENNLTLKNTLKDNVMLKEIHIDIYSNNPLVACTSPFMLLLRTIEKNVIVESNGDRLILKQNDNFKTYLMNVLLSEIAECYCEILDGHSEFILNIKNIYYKIAISN